MEAIPSFGTERPVNGAARAVSGARNETGIAADFQTFLKLLTTQLRNQDPLKPLDATSFAEQLATFSGVEQQVKTNELLSKIMGLLSTDGPSALGDWVGREVTVPRSVQFEGSPIRLTIPPAPAEGVRELVVRDPGGMEVAREVLRPDGGSHEWSGLDAMGQPRLPGLYSFEIERDGKPESELAMKPAVSGVVREALLDEGRVKLVFDGGVTASAADARAVRAGGA